MRLKSDMFNTSTFPMHLRLACPTTSWSRSDIAVYGVFAPVFRLWKAAGPWILNQFKCPLRTKCGRFSASEWVYDHGNPLIRSGDITKNLRPSMNVLANSCFSKKWTADFFGLQNPGFVQGVPLHQSSWNYITDLGIPSSEPSLFHN